MHYPIRRICHHDASLGRRDKVEHIAAGDLHAARQPGRREILLRPLDLVLEHIGTPDLQRSKRLLARLSLGPDPAPELAIDVLEPLEANSRPSPGAISSAIWAASRRKVPLPHIGSTSGSSGCQPASLRMPAARFSLSGASTRARLKPRL